MAQRDPSSQRSRHSEREKSALRGSSVARSNSAAPGSPASSEHASPQDQITKPPGIELREQTWPARRRQLISLLLLLHCLAIFASPMAGPPPASDLSRWIASWFEPYLRAGYLNHGYRFFAPNPGPSHLVRYVVTRADGSTETHRFPSTDEQWPRLFYHRHFMVAERVNQLVSMPTAEEWTIELRERRALVDDLMGAGQAGLAREVEAQIQTQQAGYDEQRKLRDELLRGIAEYFLRYHDAQSIKLYSVRHPLPSPLDVRAGAKLDDPDSYLERMVFQLPETQELPLTDVEEITP